MPSGLHTFFVKFSDPCIFLDDIYKCSEYEGRFFMSSIAMALVMAMIKVDNLYGYGHDDDQD